MANVLSAEYDQKSDVLYILTNRNAPAISREEEIGMVWRYAVDGDRLVGLTLIEFQGYWRAHLTQVAREMSHRFGITQREARGMLESVH
jgi:uncharacterized protein YuzE